MKTTRTLISLVLSLMLLIGAEGTLLLAQAAPPAAGTKSVTIAKDVDDDEADDDEADAKTPPAEATDPVAETFSKEQLEQLVAPIALYTDALLIQIMMASTYPIEIVEADRFMRKSPDLKGEALEKALLDQDWDPSVESLCTVPEVLKRMSENLDWTQDLGDAFLGQKDELLDTVQDMRNKANDAGNLKTTEQQVVTVKEEKIIVIESAKPEVVYVPTYSPSVVYGGWYPPYYYYPPMYPYYPYGAGFVAFGVGIAVGAAFWGGCGWGRGRNNVYINHHSYNNFNRNTNRNHNNLGGDRGNWNHNASHRKGVGYQNSKVAGQYGGKSGANRVSKGQGAANAQARGHSASGNRAGSGQAGSRASSASGNRASSASANRASGASGNRASTSAKPSASRSGSYGSSGKSAYSGSSASRDRASSYRGSTSRGTRSYGGSYGGGGYRGGGGSRGGGGGRRR
jgi:hypothetical protein